MALDPRKQFGTLGQTAFNAPKAAHLVPTNSIEGASLTGQVAARLADTIVDATETIRKTSILNERQQMDAMGAQLSAKEAQIRADMVKEEIETGRKFTPDEQTSTFSQRLDEARADLKGKYRFDFIPDEADAYYTKHKEVAVANHTKQVVLPRMAELNRDSLLSEVDGNQKAAAALMAAGDIDGALAKTQAAAGVLDKPNAAVVFDPAQRSANQQKILQDGAKDILFSLDPEKRMELLKKDMSLKSAAQAAGDPTLAMASPLKGIDQTFLANMLKHTDGEIRQEAERKRMDERRAEAEKANKFQFDQTDFMLNPKTSTGALQKRLFEVMEQGRSLAQTNPGSPMLDAFGAAGRQMQNEMESRQRKAEAAAEKAARKAKESVDVGGFLTSGQVVDPTNKGSRALGNAAYAQLESRISKLPPAEQDQQRLALIGRLKYIPEQVERQITQGLTSDNPELRKLTLGKVKAITDVAPSAILNLPQRERTITQNVLRNGMPIEKAIKDYDNDAIRSPEEKKIIEHKANVEIGEKGKYKPDAVLGKTFDGAKVPVQTQATYNAQFSYYYSTNGGDAAAASKSATDEIARNSVVTKSDGTAVVRQKQPVLFGVKPEQEKDQVSRALQARGLTGRENYRLHYINNGPDGKPNYGVEVANKAGVMTPLPGALAIDKDEPVYVAPPAAPKVIVPPTATKPGEGFYDDKAVQARTSKRESEKAAEKKLSADSERAYQERKANERATVAQSMEQYKGRK